MRSHIYFIDEKVIMTTLCSISISLLFSWSIIYFIKPVQFGRVLCESKWRRDKVLLFSNILITSVTSIFIWCSFRSHDFLWLHIVPTSSDTRTRTRPSISLIRDTPHTFSSLSQIILLKNPSNLDGFFVNQNGGGTEIRTLGTLRHGSFQDCCIKPLCHPSGCVVGAV